MAYLGAEELLPKFDGRDKTQSAARWAQDVEENAEIFQWRPLQTLIFARRALSGTAALWLKSERPYKTWDELKTALIEEFPDTLDSKAVHEMMSERKKRRGERCIDYMLIMKELGKRGKIPDYVAIKYIIDGIIDEEVNKIMLYGVTTYSELKDKLRIYESVKEKMTTTTRNKKDTQSERNFKYNEFGHISTQCKMRGDDHMGPGGSSKKEKACSRTMSEKRRSAMFAAMDLTNRDACMCNHDTDCGGENVTETSTSNEDSEVMQVTRKDLDCGKDAGKALKTVTVAEKQHSSSLIDSSSDGNLMSAELCGVDVTQPLGGLPADDKEVLLKHSSNQLVRREAPKCIEIYHPVQVKEAPPELRIVLKGDVPVAQRLRRVSYIEKQVDKWPKDGITREKVSEYNSPSKLVNKKDYFDKKKKVKQKKHRNYSKRHNKCKFGFKVF